jgi:hypothetical protein
VSACEARPKCSCRLAREACHAGTTPQQQRRRQNEQAGEREHPHIGDGVQRGRLPTTCRQGDQTVTQPPRQQRPGGGGQDGQQQAFGQRLAHKPAPRGAEGGTDAHLALALDRARQH